MNIYKISNKDYEYAKLRTLWVETFNDEPSEVDSIYENLSATGYVLEDDGVIKSCLTTFCAGTFQGKIVQVIYAVCTAPEFRNQGYAGKLVKEAVSDIESGGDIALTCPADADLEAFYRKLGMKHCSYEPIYEAYASEELAVTVEIIDVNNYASLRESFLKDIPHLVAKDELIKQVRDFSVNGEATLLINGGDAICIVDWGTEGEMYVSELLVHPLLLAHSGEIASVVASALAHRFAAMKCTYRTALNYDGGQFYFGLQME